MASLKNYRVKRDFAKTAEPRGAARVSGGKSYVIQKHAARRLHYDLRLELDGAMMSWAVTRGPSLVPGDKRLAIHVEDHPVEYNQFEGTIPQGEYGGGTVMIWDRGRWFAEGDPHEGMARGRLDFHLAGEKLKGRWHLVRMRKRPGERQEPWLLIKSQDEFARDRSDPDILGEKPKSVVSGRSIEQIAAAAGGVWRPDRSASDPAKKKARSKPRPRRAKPATATRTSSRKNAQRPADVTIAGVRLTHADRVYWSDAGITKRMLAEYYQEIWDWIAPHLVNRPLALVRCPAGATAEKCFFQKHASAGLEADRLKLIAQRGGRPLIAVDDLAGLVVLAQASVLEIHAWGTHAGALDRCDRLVFDLDPGPGVAFASVIAAAREVRERLRALALKSFVKTTGGKGLHVVVPVAPVEWDTAKNFARAVALAMARDDPHRYVATMAMKLRKNRIFIDYLRNARGATAIAPYSPRARPGATIATPLSWSELGGLRTPNGYTLLNLPKRLARLRADPWVEIAKIRQKLPPDGIKRERA